MVATTRGYLWKFEFGVYKIFLKFEISTINFMLTMKWLPYEPFELQTLIFRYHWFVFPLSGLIVKPKDCDKIIFDKNYTDKHTLSINLNTLSVYVL